MRIATLSTLAFLALSTPALAQTTVADIGPNADRDFWCAAAFGVLVYTLDQQGQAEASATANTNMTALFTGLAIAMQGKSQPKEDYDALVAQYTAAVMDPFARGAKSYSREECDAAAVDAVAAMPAQ